MTGKFCSLQMVISRQGRNGTVEVRQQIKCKSYQGNKDSTIIHTFFLLSP